MAMSSKFAIIGGKTFNVFDQDQLFKNRDILVEDDQAAIECKVEDKVNILPITSETRLDKPGVYISKDSPYAVFKFPKTKEEKELYEPDNDHIVDFSNAENMQNIVDKKQHMDVIMNQYLEAGPECGNIFKPIITSKDSAAMKGLKQCLIEKHIELDKYAERFGANFPNDKRKLKDTDITLFLLGRMAEKFDLNVDMVFRDANSDVPNPMGKVITVSLSPDKDSSMQINSVVVE